MKVARWVMVCVTKPVERGSVSDTSGQALYMRERSTI
jgi:hypothetical protein